MRGGGAAGWQSAALVSRNVKWKDVCGGCVHPAMAELSCVVSKVCMWLQLTAEERPTVPKVSAPPLTADQDHVPSVTGAERMFEETSTPKTIPAERSLAVIIVSLMLVRCCANTGDIFMTAASKVFLLVLFHCWLRY